MDKPGKMKLHYQIEEMEKEEVQLMAMFVECLG